MKVRIKTLLTAFLAVLTLTMACAATAFAEQPATGPALEIAGEQVAPGYSASSQASAQKEGKRTVAVEYGKPGDYLGNFYATAYCGENSAGEPISRMTYSGKDAVAKHTISADLDLYPLGTKLLIGDIVYTVEDCGGSIKGNKLDIFFDTYREAMDFGVQYVDVYLAE